MPLRLKIDRELLGAVCCKYNIQRLAIFGSAVRSDFRDSSDVDVLVEFLPGETPSLFKFPELADELSVVFEGRRVDLVTTRALNHRMRDAVIAEAEVQYVKAG